MFSHFVAFIDELVVYRVWLFDRKNKQKKKKLLTNISKCIVQNKYCTHIFTPSGQYLVNMTLAEPVRMLTHLDTGRFLLTILLHSPDALFLTVCLCLLALWWADCLSLVYPALCLNEAGWDKSLYVCKRQKGEISKGVNTFFFIGIELQRFKLKAIQPLILRQKTKL